MQEKQIQWFPGHMAKTRRMISENLKNVDIVIEILDARIPRSSKNPEIARLIGQKTSLVLLNKCSLADPARTKEWVDNFTSDSSFCIATDCITGEGLKSIAPAVKGILSEKVERYEMKGMNGRSLKAMILGIPNVGKSSLINKLCGAKKAKVENRPGVTLDKQWVATNAGLDLLDMPGVLWPKFDDRTVGENLALTGAIKDSILDIESLAAVRCARLSKNYPAMLCGRYKLDGIPEELKPYQIVELIGKKRGFLMSGGEINTERTANMLLDEFRSGKIGRITLDII